MLSLFSGIGGLDLAAQWAGIETVAFCEIEPYACHVLNKRFPGVPIYGDIRTITAERLVEDGIERIDIVCGGFPCQPFSCAGKRNGTEDDRYLWPEMLRIISEIRPTWVIGENVVGIISMVQSVGDIKVGNKTITRTANCDVLSEIFTRQEIMLLGIILGSIEKEGYEVQPFLIPASGVNAPHERYRTFIVAHANSTGR
jgi:DNA (cytosine-5)-methyltransferase 1